MKSSSKALPFKNRILLSLPTKEVKKLAPMLSREVFASGQTLHEAGQTIDSVFFLEEGLCSVVVDMEHGGVVEVGLIGRDGFVGIPGVFGAGYAVNRSYMQVAGSGFRVKAEPFRKLCEESHEMRLHLARGMQAFLTQMAQTAACNRVHELEERLARWLLMCQDRVELKELPVTHDLLAMMLGTRRTTVTVAAGILQSAGLIEYARGHVTILNRAALTEAACECYSIVREEYVQLGLL